MQVGSMTIIILFYKFCYIPENHSVAPNPPIRHDSMQLTVDLGPSQRASSNQSLVNEELSNQILEEIEAIEQGRLEVDSRPPEERVPVTGYTELADCTTGIVYLVLQTGPSLVNVTKYTMGHPLQ